MTYWKLLTSDFRPPVKGGEPIDFRRGRSPAMPLMQRFKRMVTADRDCLIWQGATNPDGYGRFRVDGRLVYAHRWIYTQVHGPIPDDLPLDHLCRRPSCVYVDHLELVTTLENTLRGEHRVGVAARRGTCAHGHPKTVGRPCARCHADAEARRRARRRLS